MFSLWNPFHYNYRQHLQTTDRPLHVMSRPLHHHYSVTSPLPAVPPEDSFREIRLTDMSSEHFGNHGYSSGGGLPSGGL